jgi:hypothetical protein
MQTGKKAVKAAFMDAMAEAAAPAFIDYPPDVPRVIDGLELPAGQWMGAPVDRLPPDCPVVPLGVDGKVFYFIDTLGQMQAVTTFNFDTLTLLFSQAPNYLYWAWPRFGAPGKKGQPAKINGLEIREAGQCLAKACGERGLFDPMDRVRGRGGWADKNGGLIWHAGEALYRVERGKLTMSRPGSVDGVFYARRPQITMPWPEAVTDAESPAHDLLAAFNTWIWERPLLDPVLMVGWLGAAALGGALPWRPTVFITGDRGRGKSTLQGIIKEVLGAMLHQSADTTAAGIYQRIKQDSLPVAVDELESDADNRRVMAVIKLARLAASGGEMFRGGAEHEGVTFKARNAFLFSSINTPPLETSDKSRMAILNLRKVDPTRAAAAKLSAPEQMGRQLLRKLMDEWPKFAGTFDAWRGTLRAAGFDGRGQDTYGVLLAVANLLLGDEALDAAGLPITEDQKLGQLIASMTASERADQTDNWRDCLDRLMGWAIDNWKGGERPIIGDVCERVQLGLSEDRGLEFTKARDMLMQAGLGLKRDETSRILLAIPPKGPGIEKMFAGTKWAGGVWMHALKQEQDGLVQHGADNLFVVKIAGRAQRCLLVDVAKLTMEG